MNLEAPRTEPAPTGNANAGPTQTIIKPLMTKKRSTPALPLFKIQTIPKGNEALDNIDAWKATTASAAQARRI
jgi:hypothetical protein